MKWMQKAVLIFCCLTIPAFAADGPAIQRLILEPAQIGLAGQGSSQQLQVTAVFAEDDLRDVTAEATLTVSQPDIVRIDQSALHIVSDGAITLTATYGGLQANAEVTATQSQVQRPVSFHVETLAALTKAGCNMGACHGAPSGKGGFRLSLRGYDPALDLLTLRTEDYGRRTNPLQPEHSLLLKKPLMDVAHGGGRRISRGDAAYAILVNWIREGMQVDAADAVTLDRIEVFPSKRIFQPEGSQQQLRVQGYFSDGSVRDVTPLTVFSSSKEAIAAVDEAGLVTCEKRGEVAVLARYLDKMDTSELTFLADVPSFAWKEPAAECLIDEQVNAKLQQLRIEPSELCTDADFIRRVTLDLTGQLPTLAETTAFVNDADPQKRQRVIDSLLDSQAYAAFWGLKWADVLRVNSKTLTAPGVHKFTTWITDTVRRDQPMDEFARELLTAQGSVFENPAANYWRASREPTDAVEATAQLFLGIRIQCAKCHNHPFERWSQDDYYGMAAAFARVGRKATARADEEIIFSQSAGEVVQPRTNQTMKVRLLLQGEVEVPTEQDRRDVFATWLTSPENPFFAKSIVNRVWGHLFSRGIVEPVDDFRDSNPPSNAPLLEGLAKQFVEHGYRRKWLLREILLSRTYQRSSSTNPTNAEDVIYYSHTVPRMLSAEQLLDAVCGVTQVPEAFSGLPAGQVACYLPEPRPEHEFLKVFGQPQRTMACECERSSDANLTQALQMINGPTVHEKLRSDQGRIARLINESKTDTDIVQEIYLTAVSRPPSESELQAALNHVAGQENRRFALEDVCWAVMNSKEFLFQH